ncbi:hypothetical protein [Oligoflexus tunisiensis]|uniref:hypothetical protein n=1 Tax=Oligoflexus tunisiensis TaxID=708132 RepID=UPI00114CE247|nr:hypothetical protein [Oligoflexus tunisiensis]
MRKKRMTWNVFTIMQSVVALIAGFSFGILIGWGMAVVDKAPALKERRTDLLSIVTGRRHTELSKPQYVATYIENDSKPLKY